MSRGYASYVEANRASTTKQMVLFQRSGREETYVRLAQRNGHVAPSRGDTLVYEFYQMMPQGFMILNSTGNNPSVGGRGL